MEKTEFEQRQRIASFLNLPPIADEWPVPLLDRLAALEAREGHDRLTLELHRLLDRPPHFKTGYAPKR